MRRIYISLILIFIISINLFSQKGTIKVVKPPEKDIKLQVDSVGYGYVETVISMPLTVVEQMPEFQGGKIECNKFINTNIKYPKAEREAGISGLCYVTFIVEADGSLTGIKILKGVPRCPNCDKEAIRVVSMMPKWIPGKQNGNTVRVQYNLSIGFPLK